MSDKIVDFEKYQQKNKEKNNEKIASQVSTQEEVETLIDRTRPLTKRDLLQLDLIESLAEHVHYLSKLVEKLIEDKKVLQEKLDSLDL